MVAPGSVCQHVQREKANFASSRETLVVCNTVLPHIKDITFEKYKLFLPVHLQIL